MREPASVHPSEPEGPSCPCSPPGRPPRAPRLLRREPSVSGAQAWPRPPRGADATTHSARRPGRRSRGRSGRRPWRGHRGRAGGRRSPGCRRHRSARRGRLGRAAGGSASRHGRARPRGRPLAHQPDAGRPGAHPPGCTGTRRPPLAGSLTQLTAWPGPAQAAGAAAVGRVAEAPVPAGARVLTAHAKPVLRTACGQRPGTLWGTSPPALTLMQQTLPGPSPGQSLPPGHTCIQEQHQPGPAHSPAPSASKGQAAPGPR